MRSKECCTSWRGSCQERWLLWVSQAYTICQGACLGVPRRLDLVWPSCDIPQIIWQSRCPQFLIGRILLDLSFMCRRPQWYDYHSQRRGEMQVDADDGTRNDGETLHSAPFRDLVTT